MRSAIPHLRWILACSFGLALTPFALAQSKVTGFNEREIEPQPHAFDKPDNWTLHIRFKDPRIITCEVPGQDKKKIVWYMVYQVYNLTTEPRIFVPDFELKTHDFETVHADEVSPAVQKIISEIEDPTGKLNIKNSVTISKDPIPLSKTQDAYPRMITGVAIWTDVYDRAPKTNRFSIFIAGLSDGWRKDPNSDVIRRKTLQINFQRLGDDIQNDANAIRWVDNPNYIYRATNVNLTGKPMPPEKVILEPIREEALAPRPKLPGVPVVPAPPQDLLLPPPLTVKPSPMR